MPKSKQQKLAAKRKRLAHKAKLLQEYEGQRKPQSVGASIGSSIGSSVGSWAQGALSSLFGRGDYSEVNEEYGGGFAISENTILEPARSQASPLTAAPGVPSINSVGEGAMRVQHREFIRDWDANLAPLFQIAGFRLNPTDLATFPWLSPIARNFEQWIPMGIVFEFVSTYGTAVASDNASLGSICMATQYNNTSPIFPNKPILLNHYYAVSTKPSSNLMHAVECNPDETPINVLYTNQSVGTPGGTSKFYDLGTTYFASVGQQAPAILGELWITYDIVLLKPRIEPVVASDTYPSFNALREFMLTVLGIDRDDIKLSDPIQMQMYLKKYHDYHVEAVSEAKDDNDSATLTHHEFTRQLSHSLSSLPASHRGGAMIKGWEMAVLPKRLNVSPIG